ncbi:hypothetical protein DM01DRAFT_1231032 [Hesseltinella vesiculosa]|uniref:Uncharacterized protein n=1 Tax=Hesseltinella vesiculosa TaxID=101127 RepID=A0A1X2GN81_9FUNG|nr:hypothetical protein DM01DRAFT_1231032 [Hesseltinella vesiculosa]
MHLKDSDQDASIILLLLTMIFRKLWSFASRVFVLPIHLFFISLRYTLPVYIRSCLHFLSISRHHSRYCSPSSSMIRRPCVQDTFFTMKLHVPIKNIVPPCIHIQSSKQRSTCCYNSCYFLS